MAHTPREVPVPSPFLRYREESDAEFHERLLAEFIEYLNTSWERCYEHELVISRGEWFLFRV